MRVYPVAIAVAWQMWSRDVDDEAPSPKKRSKVQQAIVKSRALLHKRRIKNVARDEDAHADDYLALEIGFGCGRGLLTRNERGDIEGPETGCCSLGMTGFLHMTALFFEDGG